MLDKDSNIVSTFGSPLLDDNFPSSIDGDSLSWNRIKLDSGDFKLNWEPGKQSPGSFHIPYIYYGESLKITEIYPGTNEWIEVRNFGLDSINLKDWRFGSKTTQNLITSNDFFVPPREYCIILADSTSLSCNCRKVQALNWLSLSLNSFHLQFVSPSNLVADSVTYNSDCFSILNNYSIEIKDFSFPSQECSSWFLMEKPTPCDSFPYTSILNYDGEENVIINEFMFDPLDNQTEWIELYNNSTDTVLIHNWRIGDEDYSGAKKFASTPFLFAPKEYLLVLKEDLNIVTYLPDLLCKWFVPDGWETLSNAGDVIALYNSSGDLINSISYELSDFPKAAKGISIEKGLTDFKSSLSPFGATPGYKNSISADQGKQCEFILLNRRVFPGSVGSNAKIRIKSENYTEGDVSCRIFDLKGRKVRTFGFKQVIEWDGRGEGARQLKPGIYVVTVFLDNKLKLKEAVLLLWSDRK